MKSYVRSHLIGFGLFNFVVVAFVLVFAFFNTKPIPQVAKVDQPETMYQSKTGCGMKSRNTHHQDVPGISHEILSSQYFLNEQRIVTKVLIKRENEAIAPDRIFVSVSYSANLDEAKKDFRTSEQVSDPFAATDERLVTIVSDLSGKKRLGSDRDVYALVNVTDNDPARELKNIGDITRAKEVLFVYGEDLPIDR